MIETGKAVGRKILKLIRSWLKLIPGVNKFFLEQEAKIKTDKIVDLAWRTGDPGIVFIDRINEANPTPHLGKIESTNPCGEQPLLPYESCNLASINLSHMMKKKGDTYEIDHPRLASTIKTAVRATTNERAINIPPFESHSESINFFSPRR